MESPALRVVLSIEQEPRKQKTTQPGHKCARGNACENNASISFACCHSGRQAGWEPQKCSVAKIVPKSDTVIGAAAVGRAREPLGSHGPWESVHAPSSLCSGDHLSGSVSFCPDSACSSAPMTEFPV